MKERQWWDLLEANRKDLVDLVANYHPGGFVRGVCHKGGTTAPMAEAACDLLRIMIAKTTRTDPVLDFEIAVRMKDIGTVLMLLNSTWFGVPESTDWPNGFGVLCDLCTDMPEDW